MTLEIWKSIPEYPGYEASSVGRIRRSAPGVKTFVGRIMSLTRHKSGYVHVGLTVGGKQKIVKVHRLVAWAFHGASPEGKPHVLHGNGKRGDNRQENLRWGSREENQQDRRRHGTWHENETHPGTRLTDAQVADIRADLACRDSYSVVAARYGISRSHVWSIAKGRKRRSEQVLVFTNYDAALAFVANDPRIKRLIDRISHDEMSAGRAVPGVATIVERIAA